MSNFLCGRRDRGPGVIHSSVRAVGVVVPAHQEADLLPSCLAALDLAARLLPGIAVHLVVAADACTDRTADLAAAAGAVVVDVDLRNVGGARRAGTLALLRRTTDLDPRTLWIATTDADTLVPPCWLSRQLRYAEAGWEAVVGTVTVTDWQDYPPHSRGRYLERYAAGRAGAWHSHVHGANLGLTAAAYLAVGGFAELPTGEDHALVAALESAGRRVLRTTAVSVVTSARRSPRAPGGFGHLLAGLDSRRSGPREEPDLAEGRERRAGLGGRR
ncbi:glycosyltransferase family 2 protein [Nonomuraea sp. NPDC050404]|uniref:glycosyltransferase n=1 Tax=Nonomuraea sp. NPDC050404 TaxID=3155783 RepID=UPI0033D7A65A